MHGTIQFLMPFQPICQGTPRGLAWLKSTESFSNLSIEDSLKGLQTNRANGLSAKEADQRLKLPGHNEIPEKSESFFHRISRRFWGPIPWMIEAAALLSALVGKWEDFTIIMILLITDVFIDFWPESKALNALKVSRRSWQKMPRFCVTEDIGPSRPGVWYPETSLRSKSAT